MALSVCTAPIYNIRGKRKKKTSLTPSRRTAQGRHTRLLPRHGPSLNIRLNGRLKQRSPIQRNVRRHTKKARRSLHQKLTRQKKNSKSLSTSLQNVHVAASPPHLLPSVPPELLEYVENGRNPDIYTREFVELVRRGNQLMRGKQSAFASFRDILAEQMSSAMPELREDVAKVLEATGGNPAIATGGAAAAGQSGSGTSNLPARPASTVQGGQTGSQ